MISSFLLDILGPFYIFYIFHYKILIANLFPSSLLYLSNYKKNAKLISRLSQPCLSWRARSIEWALSRLPPSALRFNVELTTAPERWLGIAGTCAALMLGPQGPGGAGQGKGGEISGKILEKTKKLLRTTQGHI